MLAVTEKQQMRKELEGMIYLHNNCKNQEIRSKIRERIIEVGVEFIEDMDLDSISKFRDIVSENSPGNIEIINKKLSNSEKIKDSISKDFSNAKSLSAKMDFYKKYKNWGNGCYSIHIIEDMLNNKNNEKELNSTVGIKFLISVICDLNCYDDINQEDQTKRLDLINKIISNKAVSNMIDSKIFFDLGECTSITDRINLFKKYEIWNSYHKLYILDQIFKKCNRSDLNNKSVIDFLASALEEVKKYENIPDEYENVRNKIIELIIIRINKYSE